MLKAHDSRLQTHESFIFHSIPSMSEYRAPMGEFWNVIGESSIFMGQFNKQPSFRKRRLFFINFSDDPPANN
jgi:hypothetical protein